MDAATEFGRNPVSKTRFSLSSMEMSTLTRDGTGRLPIPSGETKFSGVNGDREILIFSVQLTTSRIGNLAVDLYHAPRSAEEQEK